MRRGVVLLGVGLVVWAVQAASVRLLFGHDVIASLLSPGAHSSSLALAVGLGFVLSRLAALVVAPALGLVGVASVLLGFVRRNAN